MVAPFLLKKLAFPNFHSFLAFQACGTFARQKADQSDGGRVEYQRHGQTHSDSGAVLRAASFGTAASRRLSYLSAQGHSKSLPPSSRMVLIALFSLLRSNTFKTTCPRSSAVSHGAWSQAQLKVTQSRLHTISEVKRTLVIVFSLCVVGFNWVYRDTKYARVGSARSSRSSRGSSREQRRVG